MERSSPFYSQSSPHHIILKVVGDRCNLRCDYCFELKKNKQGAAKLVDPCLFESFLRWMKKPTGIVLHGGEALLAGKAHIASLLDTIRRVNDDTSNVTGVYLQTNGVLFDREWLELFFVKYADLGVEIAISLDGTREHNALRVFPNNTASFDAVLNAFKLIREYGGKAGLLSVVSKPMLTSSEEYVEQLASLKDVLQFVKINPLYNVFENKLVAPSITPSEYTFFLQQVFKQLFETGFIDMAAVKQGREVPLIPEPFLGYMQRLAGVSGRYCNFNKRKCLQFISFYPDGNVGICDNFDRSQVFLDYDPTKDFETCLRDTMRTEFVNSFESLVMECEKCDLYKHCTGGCISQRYFLSQVPGKNGEYCQHRRAMFNFFKGINAEGLS